MINMQTDTSDSSISQLYLSLLKKCKHYLVKFNPQTSTFWLNLDHELVLEYAIDNNQDSKRLLEDFATAEALLEIYLREKKIPARLIGSVLEKRDALLRKLIKAETYANPAIAQFLRDAASNAKDLENMIVVAVRALGFDATHMGRSSEPDGMARLNQPGGEKKIILEAKSSADVPSLVSIGFGALNSHKIENNADGCLLVAPDYPGKTRPDNEAAKRANQLKISCWTVEQLAKFVEDAESRQFHATDLLDIVLNHFSPHDVTTRLEEIASQPLKSKLLYQTILKSIRDLEKRIIDKTRNIEMIRVEVSRYDPFNNITSDEIRDAIKYLSGKTNNAILIKGEDVLVNVSMGKLVNELTRFTK